MRRGGAVWRALAASCVLILCAVPAKAVAAHGLVTGFVDAENLYGSADPSVRATWLNRTVESGAGIVRLHVFWSVVAGATPPPDPMNPASGSYEFSATDRAVRDAEARGLSVLAHGHRSAGLGGGPGAPRPPLRQEAGSPIPPVLADFMRAVAARYSGGFDPAGPDPTLPPVQALQVWNEPNLSGQLSPQSEGTTAISPGYYREMLNASYGAVKAVDPQNARRHRRDRSLWRSSRWQPGEAGGVLATDALRDGREEEAQEEAQGQTRRQGRRLPGEFRRARPPPDQHKC